MKPNQTLTAASVNANQIDVRDARLFTPAFYLNAGGVLGKPTLRNSGGQTQLYLHPLTILTSPVTLDVQGGLVLQNLASGTSLTTLPRNLAIEMHAVAGTTTISFNPLASTVAPFTVPSFFNAGTLRLYADPDTTTSTITIGSTPSNTALVNRGTIRVEGGSSDANTRTFNMQLYNDASGSVYFDTDTRLATGFTNRGVAIVKAGQSVTTPSVVQSAGTLDLRGAALTASRLDYSGGSILGTMTLANAPALLGLPAGFMAALNPVKLDVPSSLTVTTLQSGGNVPGEIPAGMEIRQRATASATSVRFSFPLSSVSPDIGTGFVNSGALQFSADADTTSSTVTIGDGATGSLVNRGLIQILGGSTATNNRFFGTNFYNDTLGTVEVNTNTGLGLVTTNLGSFVIGSDAAVSAFGFRQVAGHLDLTGGTLRATAFTYLGGVVTGAPTLFQSGPSGGTLLLAGGFESVLAPLTLDAADGLHVSSTGSAGVGLMIPQGMTINQHVTADYPNALFSFIAAKLPATYAGSGIINEGVIRVGADATTTTSTATIGPSVSMTLVNRGTIEVAGGSTETNTRIISSRLYNDSTGQLLIKTNTSMASELVNTGVVSVGPGAELTLSSARSVGGVWQGSFVSPSEAISISGGVTQFAGSIAGSVEVKAGGTLSPGVGAGELTVSNQLSFEPGSSLELQLGSPTLYDRVAAGTLIALTQPTVTVNVDSLVGFTPLPGMRFENVIQLTGGTLDGITFLPVNDTGLSGLVLNLLIDGASADLVLGGVAGDANVDASVDFDDLLVLAQHYGLATGQTWATGDFTSDSAVNFDDLLLLAQNYGTHLVADDDLASVESLNDAFLAQWSLAQSLVPEPTAAVLMIALGPVAVGRRRCDARQGR